VPIEATYVDEDEPTQRIPSCVRIVITRFQAGPPVDELLYRVALGDHPGALDCAQMLFERHCIPIFRWVGSLADLALDWRAELVLSCVDGAATLEDIIRNDCGLDVLDALGALCELLDKDVVSLH
jgi:hypothetical protein